MNKKIIIATIAMLLIPTLGLTIAQTTEEQEVIEDNKTTINLGTLEYGLLKMNFIPKINLINTTATTLNFEVGKTGSISLASFVNKINGFLITPDKQVYEIESLQIFAIDFEDEGNYTIQIVWESWIPVIGGLVEKLTGSGVVEITIIYTIPEEPSKIVDYSMYFIVAMLGAILLSLFLGRKQIRVWLK